MSKCSEQFYSGSDLGETSCGALNKTEDIYESIRMLQALMGMIKVNGGFTYSYSCEEERGVLYLHVLIMDFKESEAVSLMTQFITKAWKQNHDVAIYNLHKPLPLDIQELKKVLEQYHIEKCHIGDMSYIRLRF